MKPMKFFNSHFTEKNILELKLFRKNIFKHRKKLSKKAFKYINFRYNRWHISINWTSIEIIIKFILQKALK